MNKHIRIPILTLLFASLLLSACTKNETTASTPDSRETLYQVSTLDSLTAGNYDGLVTAKEVLNKGDFGIGTFDGLDGEMLTLDGKIYQVKDTGKVETPGDSIKLPFLAITYFDSDITKEAGKIQNFETLKAALDQMIIKKDRFYAIRVDGTFSKIKVRSVPKQQKPYPILTEVTKNQPVFNYENVKGTLLGFWCPPYIGTLNAQGYHLHFISDDRTQGGHLLDVSLENAAIKLDETRFFDLQLSESAQQDGGIKDKQAEIDKAEK